LAQLMRERFKEPARAIETLRIALEDDPTFSDAVVTLSQLYEEQGRDEELAELLTEQIRAAQQRGDTASELSLEVRLAEVYEGKLADTQRATETYARVLERDPRHPGALRARVRLGRKNGDADSTRHFLEQLWAVVTGAEQLQVGGELVQAQLDAGELAQAAVTLEKLVELEPSDSSLRARLRELYQRSQAWSKLGELLTRDAERQSEAKQRSAGFREAARIYQQQLSDPGRGAELLELASAADSTDRALLLELCDAYNASGQADKAITALEKVVESFGGRRSKELADVHRRLAAAYQAQGQSDRAAAELDRAFRIEPGNVHVLKALGVLSLELNDLPRAQQMFRALLLQKLEAGSPITKAEVFYYLAVVHQRLGEGPKAIQMLERALQADPNLTSAQQLMAQLRG
jgi:tetratricopeptide (TPR) repeat protein